MLVLSPGEMAEWLKALVLKVLAEPRKPYTPLQPTAVGGLIQLADLHHVLDRAAHIACVDQPDRVTGAREAVESGIPKLTLQPLVENCIRHGLNGELEQISIIVSANEVDGLIEIAIQDDGRGMSGEMLEKLLSGVAASDSGGGLGFRNINERIQLYFGPEYGLNAQSKEGEGTRVTLKIPFRTDADFDPQTGMPGSEGAGEP